MRDTAPGGRFMTNVRGRQARVPVSGRVRKGRHDRGSMRMSRCPPSSCRVGGVWGNIAAKETFR